MNVLDRLDMLRRREHGSTCEIIAELCECHTSRAYAEAGYASVWELMVRRMKYSPAAASRRNAAMRCALEHPVVLEMLRTHRTSLSALHTVRKALMESADPVALLRAIDGATQSQVEKIVAGERPMDRPKERVRRVVVKDEGAGSLLAVGSTVDGKSSAAEVGSRATVVSSASEFGSLFGTRRSHSAANVGATADVMSSTGGCPRIHPPSRGSA